MKQWMAAALLGLTVILAAGCGAEEAPAENAAEVKDDTSKTVHATEAKNEQDTAPAPEQPAEAAETDPKPDSAPVSAGQGSAQPEGTVKNTEPAQGTAAQPKPPAEQSPAPEQKPKADPAKTQAQQTPPTAQLAAPPSSAEQQKPEAAKPTEPAPEKPAEQIPAPPAEQAVASNDLSGEEIYKSNCLVCHGADLSGGRAPDLSKIGDKRSVESLQEKIMSGGRVMPAFEDKLTKEEIAALAEWLAAHKS